MTESRNLPKFCPRCGAFYRDLPSETCPQCFGRLEVMDPDQAENVSEALVEHQRQNPQVKAQEDERYREQAFGGCAALVSITVVTIVAAVLIVVAAAHRKLPQAVPPSRLSFGRPDTVLPVKLAGESRTELTINRRSATTTFTTIRATYGPDLQVFAAPSDIPPQQRDAFHISANIVLGSQGPSFKHDEIVVHGADFLVFSRSVDTISRAINQLAQ